MQTMLRVLYTAKRYWPHLALALVAVLISTIAGFYAPWAMRDLTALATEGSPDFAQKALRIGLLLLGATVLQAIGSAASSSLNHYAALHYVRDMRAALYGKMQSLSLRYFHKSRTGDLSSRIAGDAMDAEILLAHIIPDTIVSLFTFVVLAAVLVTINAKLALLSLLSIPLLLSITFWQSKRLGPMWQQASRARGELSGKVQDNLSGIKEIQIFNRQQFEGERVRELVSRHSSVFLRASLFYYTSHPLLAFCMAIGSVVVVIVGGQLVAAGEASIADIVGFVLYLGMFYGPVKSLSALIEDAGKAVASCARVFEVMDETADIRELPGARPLVDVRGRLEFRDVSFAYTPEMPVLERINLRIEPGQTVALVGTTGVGKTTLASLLNRFYDPQAGSVYVDGIDIRQTTLASLRSHISMVLQDTFLFHGTVYDNIVYGKENATREQVIAAAKGAHAHAFIGKLEHGYDTVIGERGVRLSGGQKQRLSIARAVLRDAPILILDEATSSLDTKTEQDIQAALDEVSKGRTTLVIAHRLSTIRHADMIVVLDGTGIAETGTHDELVRRDGLYARLYTGQVS